MLSYRPNNVEAHTRLVATLEGLMQQDDPRTSALDIHCKAHDLDDLHVVDGSFFPAGAAVNAHDHGQCSPGVGEHLKEHMG